MIARAHERQPGPFPCVSSADRANTLRSRLRFGYFIDGQSEKPTLFTRIATLEACQPRVAALSM